MMVVVYCQLSLTFAFYVSLKLIRISPFLVISAGSLFPLTEKVNRKSDCRKKEERALKFFLFLFFYGFALVQDRAFFYLT